MPLDPRELNARLRGILEAKDRQSPGVRTHAERVAVYSVAVGQRLGWGPKRLVRLRVAAELSDIVALDPEIEALRAVDSTSRSIVRLCAQFDLLRSASGGDDAAEDEDCAAWLQAQVRAGFPAKLVDALLAVQSLIQPIGT